MNFTVGLLLICAIFGAALAVPKPVEIKVPPTPKPEITLNLQGGGGGQRGDGFGFHVSGSQNVYKSDNGRHEVDVNGGYGQHLGGPYGNSQPSYNFGANYKYRW
ncbi:hypothetical protein KR018_005644 [Drosophila ironensis]|nr:hypothetical protein KR018_005644 [Drosophila ironensis]